MPTPVLIVAFRRYENTLRLIRSIGESGTRKIYIALDALKEPSVHDNQTKELLVCLGFLVVQPLLAHNNIPHLYMDLQVFSHHSNTLHHEKSL